MLNYEVRGFMSRNVILDKSLLDDIDVLIKLLTSIIKTS
jgi:hypothetical protein